MLYVFLKLGYIFVACDDIFTRHKKKQEVGETIDGFLKDSQTPIEGL